MSLRFQADADLNQAILLGILRKEPGIDFQTAHQAQLAGLIDPKVLSVASRQGRILVTHDQKTMPLHFAKFIETLRFIPRIHAWDESDLASLNDNPVSQSESYDQQS